MKLTTKNIIPIFLFSIIFTGCGSTQKDIASFHSFETECLGIELDGSQTLRVWGKGKNRSDAIEQAKKNAVRDVLFKGVTAGSKDCNMRPLITEVNAKEKYAEYFNKFFKDGGKYNNYINMKDEKDDSRLKYENTNEVSYAITVRVLRSKLQKKLREDSILKQ